MSRVKTAILHLKKRRKTLKAAKGYRHGRKRLIRLARVAVTKAGAYAYRDRRKKKRERRTLWQVQINAAVRPLGLSYNQFINLLTKKKIGLDRKILADLAEQNLALFTKIVEQVKK
ncbi:50S ribosomal protein L20 [Candidatus Falkowbacteria bacterium]|nr:50S ribosomal protein L20 [Candidatus Falkowbacteria bacterium]